MEMTTKYEVVFDYEGDWVLALLGKQSEKMFRGSMELTFVEFHNLYSNYVNSDKGYDAWNREWDDAGNQAPNFSDEYYAKYNKFIADKGNEVIKQIVNNDYKGCAEELKPFLRMLDFYIEPIEAQLHGKLKESSVDISFHIKEIE